MSTPGKPFAKNDGRMAERRRGGRVRAANRRAAATTRVVAPSETPGPLNSLEDAVRWSAWLAKATVTGKLDNRTADVAARAVREFRTSFDRAVLERRVHELERALREARRELELRDE